MPLLLGAYQHRFAGDVEAMSQHLVDQVPVGWAELGTDLLDGTPEPLLHQLVGDEPQPSCQLDDLITPDGSPPQRMVFTEDATDGLQWAYILHPHGLEVIALSEYARGPVVGWNTDPRTRFHDHPQLWSPARSAPFNPPQRATRLGTSAPASPATAKSTASSPTRR